MKGEATSSVRDVLKEEWGKPFQSEKPLVGYFCTYTPLELVHAAGAQSRRIFPPEPGIAGPLDLHRVAAHLPGFVCPYIKRALEYALAGGAPRLDGLVHAYSCDVTCGTYNIWKQVLSPQVAVMLHQPYRMNEASLEYYLDELRACAGVLESLTGQRITDEALAEATALFNRQRGHLRRLALARARGTFGAGDFLEAVLLCQLRPVEQANAFLELALEKVDASDGVETGAPDVRRVIVSGSVLDDVRALELVEQAGGRVVADDLCTGSRWFAEDIELDGDSWVALAERYLGRIPCPTRDSAAARAERLGELIRISGAGSVLFVLQKFCDPHLADVPLLREFLAAKGIPSLLLELEDEGPSSEQWKTRLETFFHLGREGGVRR